MTNSGVKSRTILAIHGFFGLPSDWSALEQKFLQEGVGQLQAIDLWSDFKKIRGSLKNFNPSSGAAFSVWCELFLNEVEKLSSASGEKPLLLGYSMGGRLALAALAKDPDLFSGAVIVSAHPGLINLEEQKARRESDADWAKKFRELPWDELKRQWDAQPVLGGQGLIRNETDFEREVLAEALEYWSLGAQPNYASELEYLDLPILFLTGEKDQKFTAIYQALAPLSKGQEHVVIRGAGHRLPWESPDEFLREIKAFFKT